MKKRIFCLLFAVIILTSALLCGCTENEEKPPFVPPPFDDAAQVGEPQVPEGLGYGEIDARGAYFFSVCGVVKVVDGSADVWFTNDYNNNIWLKLRVQDVEGNILGETGLIKPGEYVQTVNFTTPPTPGQVILLRVMSYEPDTYYSKGEVKLNTTAS